MYMTEQRERILYFMDYPLSIGGANKVLLTQAYIMQQRGYKVLVVIPNDQNGFHAPAYDQICNLYGLESIDAQFSVATCMECIEIMDAIEQYGTIERIISEYIPNLIHSTQLNITVELVARKLKIPHLMNVYQTDEQMFLIRWMNIYPQYHSADSELFSARWGTGLGIPSKCIRVAYERKAGNRTSGQKAEGVIHIVSIGVFCERKNQMEIIKFIKECKKQKQSVRLTLVGQMDNLYGEACRKLVDENELDEDVFFAGFDLDIEHYLDKANLFVLASTVESYPGVIVESMANKVPVLSTPVAGVPELLQDGKNGFLASGFEYQDIYQAFLRYQKSITRGEILRIVENAYATYLNQHTYAAIGKQLDEYYQWIIKDYYKKRKSFIEIECVKDIFGKYNRDRVLVEMGVEVKGSMWFLYHVFSMLEKRENKKIIIWGAGVLGRFTLNRVCQMGDKKLEPVGFIDMNKRGEYLGYPIIQDKDAAIEKCGAVFVAVLREKDRLEIMAYLDEHGKVRNRDYFMIYNAPVRI